MDAILTQLLSFPPHPPPTPPLTDAEYDKQAKAHSQTVSKIAPQKLTGSVTGGGNLLNILNPAINSISYVQVLIANIYIPGPKNRTLALADAFAPNTPLWTKLTAFMEQFDPIQMRYSGVELRRLIELMAQRAFQAGYPFAAIPPIRSAILRIDPSSSTFTPSHYFLAHVAVASRAYAAALPVLDKDIYHFPLSTTKATEAASDPLYPYLCSSHESSSTYINTISGLTDKSDHRDHMKYFLFGAMCYIGLKDWDRAILFLEIVMISPTQFGVASRIQVEAYRKWILVSLLKQGKVPGLPKTLNSQTIKLLQNLSKAYTILAETFKKGIDNEESVNQLLEEANAADTFWRDDSNVGLIKQVINAYREFSVRRLEQTYAALPISEVTRRTSPDGNDHAETGQYVIRLTSSGKLRATISKPTGDPATWILRFMNSSTDGAGTNLEEQRHDELTRQVEKVQLLMGHVKEADRKYGVSKEYISEARRLQKDKGAGQSGVEEDSVWAPPEAYEHDEDMMAD